MIVLSTDSSSKVATVALLKDNTLLGLENLKMFPNSEMIEIRKTTSIPEIERVDGLSSLIIVDICLFSVTISLFMFVKLKNKC